MEKSDTMLLAVFAGQHACALTEHAVEIFFIVIPCLFGNLLQGKAGMAQIFLGLLHADTAQIVNKRTSADFMEALTEITAAHVDTARNFIRI